MPGLPRCHQKAEPRTGVLVGAPVTVETLLLRGRWGLRLFSLGHSLDTRLWAAGGPDTRNRLAKSPPDRPVQ